MPTSSATARTAPIVSRFAPFPGAQLYSHVTYNRIVGCTNATASSGGSYNASDGVVNIGILASEGKCHPKQLATTEYAGFIGVRDIAFHVPSNGTRTVVVRWNVSAVGQVQVTGAGNITHGLGGDIALLSDFLVIVAGAFFAYSTTPHVIWRMHASTNRTDSVVTSFGESLGGLNLVTTHTYLVRAFLYYVLIAYDHTATAPSARVVTDLSLTSGANVTRLDSIEVY